MTQSTIGGAGPIAVPAVARAGTAAHMVRIRAVPSPQATATVLSGLPDPSRHDTRDRIRAAIANSGLRWPDQAVELDVFPHRLPAGDCGLDLAFAVALLAVTDQVPRDRLADIAYVGELGLDGCLRPVPDVAERISVIAKAGIAHAVVPAGNLTDAVTIGGVTVRAARTLGQLVDGLHGRLPLLTPMAWPHPPTWPGADLADLPATHPGRRILEIAAAGGHHLAMFGPNGAGKAMLAQRLPGLLPDLDEPTAAQVAQLYRTAGLLSIDAPVLSRPPWQAPHHTGSVSALTGNPRRPGAVSLAHGGVLFCDEAGELPAAATDTLRHVLDMRRIILGPGHIVYPARVQLVLATTGCPQAAADCICTPGIHRRYLARLSGVLDRVDIQAMLPAMTPDPTGQPGEASAYVAARVARARAVAAARWAGHRCITNAEATSNALRVSLAGVAARRFELLGERVAAGSLSTRGAVGVLRLAWTIADLAGHAHPTAGDLAEAMQLRTGRDPVA